MNAARTLIFACAAWLAAPVAAEAAPDRRVVIRNDPGGMIERYDRRFSALAARGTLVSIEGYCASACTLLLHYVPRDRICYRRGARFEFHSALMVTVSVPDGKVLAVVFDEEAAAATLLAFRLYPLDVQRELVRRGWRGETRHDDLISVPAEKFVARCGEARGG